MMNREQVDLYFNNLKLVQFTFEKKMFKSAFIFHWKEDVLGAGRVGLLEACLKYKPEDNIKFAPFAVNAIYWRMLLWVRAHGDFQRELSYDVLKKGIEDGSDLGTLIENYFDPDINQEESFVQNDEDIRVFNLIKEILFTLSDEDIELIKSHLLSNKSFDSIKNDRFKTRQSVEQHYSKIIRYIKMGLYLISNDLNVPRLKYYKEDERDRFKKDFSKYVRYALGYLHRDIDNMKESSIEEIQEHKDIYKHHLGSIANGSIVFYEYEKDKGIPHIHFEDKINNTKGCIRLDKPYYFNHGKYNGTIPEEYRTQLKRWMKSDYRYLIATNMWNKYNKYFEFPLEVPNYLILKKSPKSKAKGSIIYVD